jgi:hypothetical protein
VVVGRELNSVARLLLGSSLMCLRVVGMSLLHSGEEEESISLC